MSKVFMKFDKNIARWRFWKKVPNSVSCTQFLENETLLGIFKHCNNILFVGLLVIVGPQFLFSLRVLKNLKRRQNGTSIFLCSIFASYTTCWRCYFSLFSDPVYKVRCSSQEMTVELVKPYDVKHIYLEHLKHYPGNERFPWKLKNPKMSISHFNTEFVNQQNNSRNGYGDFAFSRTFSVL